ncbi:MAG TPA: Hsp20/alpha crystallin family protein [Acidimicrobiales bacterium]|nr:Hsp20/alpha crystallin family protein [Acidimicrobiales bacterium]
MVEIELAGVDKDDVNIELSGRRLVVTGERKERERAGILRKRTRMIGRFRSEVVLPTDVDEEAVTAELDRGVLTVRVPKAASERPRRITVH